MQVLQMHYYLMTLISMPLHSKTAFEYEISSHRETPEVVLYWLYKNITLNLIYK